MSGVNAHVLLGSSHIQDVNVASIHFSPLFRIKFWEHARYYPIPRLTKLAMTTIGLEGNVCLFHIKITAQTSLLVGNSIHGQPIAPASTFLEIASAVIKIMNQHDQLMMTQLTLPCIAKIPLRPIDATHRTFTCELHPLEYVIVREGSTSKALGRILLQANPCRNINKMGIEAQVNKFGGLIALFLQGRLNAMQNNIKTGMNGVASILNRCHREYIIHPGSASAGLDLLHLLLQLGMQAKQFKNLPFVVASAKGFSYEDIKENRFEPWVIACKPSNHGKELGIHTLNGCGPIMFCLDVEMQSPKRPQYDIADLVHGLVYKIVCQAAATIFSCPNVQVAHGHLQEGDFLHNKLTDGL
jgi:hypothetical protein